MVDAAMAEFGQVDVLVNNAGVGTAVPATRETPEEFRAVVDINLNGSYWAAQACAHVMQPGSSIVNISSVLGLTTAGCPRPPTARARPPHRVDPGSCPAVGFSQGHSGQRDRAGILRVRDDRRYKPGYLESLTRC